MNYSNNKSSATSKEKERAAPLTALPLDILEHMLHNKRISQKKEEIHKTQNIADTDRI